MLVGDCEYSCSAPVPELDSIVLGVSHHSEVVEGAVDLASGDEHQVPWPR